ncbi:unnamed protein product [Didymodactylos carnosus]|uniref:Gag protein n=2 Tax=Didymodactylos carnosus TaxID=1234261 RepID=A0A8S2E7U7_9BILA|nr:unnamed protein product [Didymodactylos carnosus]CAF3839815.1 unnamed protein product [Didymodactylos carnosus]
MSDSVLTLARKKRYEDLPSFSGQSSEDTERFLKSIKIITTNARITEDVERLEIARARFEELKQRKQQEGESVTQYCDDVIALCRDSDPSMSEPQMVKYLMSGIKLEFRKELSRAEPSIDKVQDFRARAKKEEDLNQASGNFELSFIQSTKPYFSFNPDQNSLTAAIQQHRDPRSYSQVQPFSYSQSSRNKANSAHEDSFQNRRNSTDQRASAVQRQNSFEPCKVCGKRNHPSIRCVHRKQYGCFNCGQNHSVRDCQQPPHFQ